MPVEDHERSRVATTAAAVGWQVWVPCIGMALCSWLSFVDRQVLNILAPTIIKDTGLTNQDFTAATSFFFLTYTLGNPVWGSVIDYIGLRKGMLLAVAVWTGASMSHSWMASFAGFALARAVLGLGEGGTFPGGLRTAVETLPADHARARHRAVVQRRHHRRGDDAAAAGAARHQLRLAQRVPRHRRARRHLDGHLGGRLRGRRSSRPRRRSRHKATWPNFRERRVWALIFSYALPAISPGPVLTILALYLDRRLGLTQAEVNSCRLGAAPHLGHRLFLLGLGRRQVRRHQHAPDRAVPAPDRGLAHARLRHVDHVAGRSPSRSSRSRRSSAAASRWWRSRRVVRVPARAVGDDDRHRLGLVVARQLRAAARRSAPWSGLDERRPLGRDLLADRAAAGCRRGVLAGAEPESGRGAGRARRSRPSGSAMPRGRAGEAAS